MRAIIKEPYKNPQVIQIDNTLEALQGAVGGYVEHVRLTDSVGILCNEDGKYNGSELNFIVHSIGDVILGTALFVGEGGEDFTDLSDADVTTLMALLQERRTE